MMHPKGWTQGCPIVILTAPNPWLKDRELAVLMRAEDYKALGLQLLKLPDRDFLPARGVRSLAFTDVEGVEEWRKWWFSVAPGTPGSFEPLPKLKPDPTPPPAPAKAVVNPFAAPPKLVAPQNPFAAPPARKNPFA